MSQQPPVTYHQLAAQLRGQIVAGRIQPGQRIPAESTLMQTYGLARETVRRAVGELRKEGLLDYRRGYGWVVRAESQREDLVLQPGDAVVARMPTPDERDRWQLGDGVPVFQVWHGDGTGDVFPGDRWQIVYRGPEG